MRPPRPSGLEPIAAGAGASRPDRAVRLSEVLSGLSYALDLTEGQRPGHAVRSCLIGMRLAEIIGLPEDDRSALFYALLMKDLGCSSNAARFAALFGADDHDLKANLKLTNWTQAVASFRFVARHAAPGHSLLRRIWQTLGVLACGPKGAREVVVTRCERGADIARLLGFEDRTVQAIRALDEHWDGDGQPYKTKGHDIPILGRILGLAQTVEVFYSTYGALTAYDMAHARSGTWFDPDLVKALTSLGSDGAFWRHLGREHAERQVGAYEPADRVVIADEARLDQVADAFARVIDAKSPWTYRHSAGVATMAVAIARRMDWPDASIRELRRAALLHDLGKLAVSSLILDKPGKLTDDEFSAMRRHPEHTYQILKRVGCFSHLADAAGAHHERLDGRGYHRHLSAGDLPAGAGILAVSDISDALRASRPYRAGLSIEQVLEIMGRDCGSAIDPAVFAAMRDVLDGADDASRPEAPAVELVAALREDYQQAA